MSDHFLSFQPVEFAQNLCVNNDLNNGDILSDLSYSAHRQACSVTKPENGGRGGQMFFKKYKSGQNIFLMQIIGIYMYL